ncbi:hypothetical protein [Streptomyces sp. A1499]|uniref:hypothetical protein n=1 Tax=Streptomyces sp. A1499 TaxID=2563104 RepID=UPI002687B537
MPSVRSHIRATNLGRRVSVIPLRECGEPLLDVRRHGLHVGDRRSDEAAAYTHVRRGVLTRLLHAHSLLPIGVQLLVVDGFRPPALQRR